MNNVFQTNIIRIVLIFIAQVLIFKQITFSLQGFAYIHFIIYPMAVLLMPVKTSRSILMALGFLLGIALDLFYDSPGIHAASLVFTAYIRNIIIAFLEPFDGYNIDDVPTLKRMGTGWFVSYVSVALIIHIFVYFSIEAFSFVFFFEIFLNTIFSFIVSLILVMVLQFILRTKY